MKVLLVDDQRLLRDALQLLIATRHPEIALDVAGTEAAAVAALHAGCHELVLLDWWLGSCDAARCFERLREVAPAARIVVLSADESPATVTQALELGAAGFLPKSMLATDELVDAIQLIAHGGIYVPSFQPRRTSDVGRPGWATVALDACFPEVTARQRDVLRVLLRGRSDKQIARELDIAPTTVKSHLKALYRTIDVSSRAEAVSLAARRGARID